MSLCPKSFDLEQWLDLVVEDAIDPTRPLVDPHHHLWVPLEEPRGDASTVAKVTKYMSRGWKERFMRMTFPKSGLEVFGTHNMVTDKYDVEDLRGDFGGHNMQRSVVIESQFIDPQAASEEFEAVGESLVNFQKSKKDSMGFPHAMVCHINLNLGKKRVAAALAMHKEANPNLVGLRHSAAYHKSNQLFTMRCAKKDMMLDPVWLSGVEAVAEAGLSLDNYIYHTQLPHLKLVAEKFPQMTIIIDHCGQPLGVGPYDTNGKGPLKAKDEWLVGMKALAELPNTVVKLSGLSMPNCGFGFEKQERPPTSDELVDAYYPYMGVLLDMFGSDRCMFASNFPVDRVSSSYGVLWNAFKKMCVKHGLSEEDKNKVLCLNAERVYKLTPVVEPAM